MYICTDPHLGCTTWYQRPLQDHILRAEPRQPARQQYLSFDTVIVIWCMYDGHAQMSNMYITTYRRTPKVTKPQVPHAILRHIRVNTVFHSGNIPCQWRRKRTCAWAGRRLSPCSPCQSWRREQGWASHCQAWGDRNLPTNKTKMPRVSLEYLHWWMQTAIRAFFRPYCVLTENTVDTVEVRAVAIGDYSEGRCGLVVAHEHLVHTREATQVRAIGIVEVKSLGCLAHESGGLGDAEVAWVRCPVWLVEKLVRVPLVSNLELTVTHPCCPWNRSALQHNISATPYLWTRSMSKAP